MAMNWAIEMKRPLSPDRMTILSDQRHALSFQRTNKSSDLVPQPYYPGAWQTPCGACVLTVSSINAGL